MTILRNFSDAKKTWSYVLKETEKKYEFSSILPNIINTKLVAARENISSTK